MLSCVLLNSGMLVHGEEVIAQADLTTIEVTISDDTSLSVQNETTISETETENMTTVSDQETAPQTSSWRKYEADFLSYYKGNEIEKLFANDAPIILENERFIFRINRYAYYSVVSKQSPEENFNTIFLI